MFSKMLIFIICFVGFFILIFALIPGEFFVVSFEGGSAGIDPEVAAYYNLANVTMYANQGQDNMTYPYSSLDHHPEAPQFNITGLPDNYLEFWWQLEVIPPGFYHKVIELRHTVFVWWGRSYHLFDLYAANGTRLVYDSDWGYCALNQAMLQSLYDGNINASFIEARCPHFVANCFFEYNTTKYDNITQAFENDELGYSMSYEVDWEATSVSAFTVLGQLMTFSSPDLGFHDSTVNLIFNALIALPIYTMVAVLILKVLLSLFPTSPGIPD